MSRLKKISYRLFEPVSYTHLLALVIGGLIILWIEDYHERKNITPRVPTIDDMTAKDAFAVG